MITNDEASRVHADRARFHLGIVATLVVASLMILMPSASAVTPSTLGLSGATKMTDYTSSAQGCARATFDRPSISLKTGNGKADVASSAKTCTAAQGGPAVVSEGESIGLVGLTAPFKLKTSATFVNVSFDLVGTASDHAAAPPTACPVSTTGGSFPVSNGTEFYNVTSGTCEALAEFAIQSTVIVSVPGGSFYANYLFTSNESGFLDNIYVEQVNYSSPLAGTNATYNYSTIQGFGSGNVTKFNTAYSLSVTGSWPAGTKLMVQAYAFPIAFCDVQNAPHATTSASFDAGTGTEHLDITAVTVS
jgi:hypothetical protein